jgi:hypothetical protein
MGPIHVQNWLRKANALNKGMERLSMWRNTKNLFEDYLYELKLNSREIVSGPGKNFGEIDPSAKNGYYDLWTK